MTTETIQTAQDYLTVISESRIKRIIDVETLLSRHPPESVTRFLNKLYKEKEKMLMELLIEDKTSSRINEVITAMFRIHMAIKTIQINGKGVMENGGAESRAASGC